MPRRSRALAAALLVVLAGVAAIVVAATVHHGRHGDVTARNPSATSEPAPSTGGKLTPASFGISTGVALFNESPDRIDIDMAAMATAGAHWIRTAVRWDLVEPDDATTDDWTKSDRIVADAQAHGLDLIFDVTGTPQWAAGAGASTNVQFPSDLHTYAAFAAKLAARYEGRVHVYELGNEPNHVKTSADPQLYTRLLQLTYPAIKASDPNATVLTGGLGGTRDKKGNLAGDTFLAQLYKDGAKGYFDGVSYHPYTYPLLASQDSGSRGWSRMLNAHRIMAANGDGAMKIWITEYGAPTNGGGGAVTEAQQAQMVTDAYRLWSTYSWSGPLCWFDYRDKGNDTSNKKDFFGLVNSDGDPKAALVQFQMLARSVR